MASDLFTDSVQSTLDAREDRVEAAAEILFGSLGLALLLNAALAFVLAADSRTVDGHATNILVASLLALGPLQSLHGRGISRAQAIALMLLSTGMAVAVRFFIYA